MSAGVAEFQPSLICPSPGDRDRFLDMNRRMLPTQNWLLLTMSVLLMPALIVTYRPLPAAIVIGSVVVQGVLQRAAVRFARPELLSALAIAVALIGMGGGAIIQGRAHNGDLAVLIWPCMVAYSRFPKHVAQGFAALAALLMMVPQVAWRPHDLLVHPLAAVVPLTALVAVAVFAAAIRESDARHRADSVLDELTGLLNRTALQTRMAELRAQAAVAGGTVGLILIDLDHFKAVNDGHGHAAGDAVLREIGERLGESLRAYDSLYRIGGEELAVLVPGATADELAELCERLRVSVRARPVAGLEVTISLGAVCSAPQQAPCWEDLYRHADRALYRAKAAGRDRAALEPAPSA